MKQKLNQTVVDEARFDERRPGLQFIWDTNLRGFGVQLLRTKKSYVINHTLGGRKVIGDAAEMKYKDAAAKAKNYLGLLGMGVNPFAAATPLEQGEMTLRQLADKYLAHPDHQLREASLRQFEGNLNTYLDDWLHKPFRAITRDMVAERFVKIEQRPDRYTNKPPAKPKTSTARAVMVTLRSLFNFAIQERLHDDDPTLTVKRKMKVRRKSPLERTTDKHQPLNDDQLKELSLVLRNWPADGNAYHPLLFRMMLLTGLRVNKALALRWEHVKDDGIHAESDLSKSDRPVYIPMTDQLRTLINELHDLSLNEWLFPSPLSASGRMTCSGAPLAALRERLNFTTTNHSFKYTFIRIGTEIQVNPNVLSMLADHAIPQHITTHYAAQALVDAMPESLAAIHAELDTRMRPQLKAVSAG